MTNPAMPTRVHAVTDDALAVSDVVALRRRLQAREVSAAELRVAAFDRLARVNTILNATTALAHRPQPSQGRDPEAPLAGIPSAIKDNENLPGLPTRFGAIGMTDRPAGSWMPWGAQFDRLGADPIAKTTMPEFGLTATTECTLSGATRNPWDTGRSSGGSSGGAAALVAAGVIPIAHANDGGGSIRIPAAACGLVGLKPSRGRTIDVPGKAKLPVQISAQGVLVRSMRDAALYYASAEQSFWNPDLPRIGHVTKGIDRPLRIALFTRDHNGQEPEAQTATAVREAGLLCQQLGHDVEEVDNPVRPQFAKDFLRYWAVLAYSLKRWGGRLLRGPYDGSQTDPITDALAEFSGGRTPQTAAAIRRLQHVADSSDPIFDRFDVILSPVLAHQPPPIGYLGPQVDGRTHIVRLLQYAKYTAWQNVTGSPALSLPLRRAEDGSPIGVQFTAPLGGEAVLLGLGLALEQVQPWPGTPATLAALN